MTDGGTSSTDTEQAQRAAQDALNLAANVSAEFGWMVECEGGVLAAKLLYEEHGPFELNWPYGITEQDWYVEPDTEHPEENP